MEPPSSSSAEPPPCPVQDELQLFEGARPEGGVRRSRRLSHHDISSLQRRDGAYVNGRRRRSSQLAKLLRAGSFRSSLQSDISDASGELLMQQQETTEETTKEEQKPQERPSLIPEESSSKMMEETKQDKVLIHDAPSSDCHRVSWNESVHVHFHEMILGFNTGVSSGVPVELSWKQLDEETQQVREAFSKTMKELRIPNRVRFDICQAAGATSVQIMSRIESCDIMRQQLVASCKRAKMEDLKALKQAQKAARKKNKSKTGGTNSNAPEQAACCIIL